MAGTSCVVRYQERNALNASAGVLYAPHLSRLIPLVGASSGARDRVSGGATFSRRLTIGISRAKPLPSLKVAWANPDARKPRKYPDVGEEMGFSDTFDAKAKSDERLVAEFLRLVPAEKFDPDQPR